MASTTTGLADLIAQRRTIVCVGPGGVGKTSTAAAVAVAAARMGRRTLVCTIDPAPRLQDALGLSDMGAVPKTIPVDVARRLGIDDERLWVARLETAAVFASLVRAEVTDPDARARIFANPIYRQVTTALTGSEEYAAVLMLGEWATSTQWDLLVLDTPPTEHAIDFLEAPRRIADAVQSPVLRWLSRPRDTSAKPFWPWQKLKSSGTLVLQWMSRLVGSRFLDDLGAFVADFEIVLRGFAVRARITANVLRRDDVGFLLVFAAERPAVDEALVFRARLQAAGVKVDALVANRVLAVPPLRDARAIAAALVTPSISGLDAAVFARAAGFAVQMTDAQQAQLHRVRTSDLGLIKLVQTPFLDADISGLGVVAAIADHLLTSPPVAPGDQVP